MKDQLIYKIGMMKINIIYWLKLLKINSNLYWKIFISRTKLLMYKMYFKFKLKMIRK